MCEHHKCFILPMHRLGCWKRVTVVFCAGTCLCNISWVFVFTSLLPFPPVSTCFTHRGGRDAKTIVLIFVRRVNEIVSAFLSVSRMQSASFFFLCFSFFFFLSNLTQIIEDRSLVKWRLWKAPKRLWSPLETTAAKRNRLQLQESAGLYTEVTS